MIVYRPQDLKILGKVVDNHERKNIENILNQYEYYVNKGLSKTLKPNLIHIIFVYLLTFSNHRAYSIIKTMKGMSKMYNYYRPYPWAYYVNSPMHNNYRMYPYPSYNNAPIYNTKQVIKLKDYGPDPFVFNIEKVTKQNNNFRTALWTGEYLQLTLMSIPIGESIGLEIHPDLDQFVRIEEGQGIIMMGDKKNNLNFQRRVFDDYAFIIPAGKWHNLINTGNIPIKLYSIYAPPQHPYGTIHKTKADAQAAEEKHGH